jgi:hypothetical protein
MKHFQIILWQQGDPSAEIAMRLGVRGTTGNESYEFIASTYELITHERSSWLTRAAR